MDADQYEKMWELMREFDLNFVDEIASIYKCWICKNIIINAVITPCDCRFCFRCVNRYLEDGPKPCPGPSDLCKDELLDLSQNNRNVFINRGMNSKISKLQTNCPNGACQSIMELSQLADHLIICDHKPQICPFASIGCRQDQMTRDQISQHISIDNMDHVQLMIDYICQSNNELNELKRQLINCKSDNELEKEKMRLENKELMGKLQVRIDEMNEMMRQDQQNAQEKINEMNETMMQDRQNAQNAIQLLVGEINTNKAKIDSLSKEMNALIHTNQTLKEESMIAMTKLLKIVEPSIITNESGETIWTIKNWRNLFAKRRIGKGEEIFIKESDPFDHQGYQICLMGALTKYFALHLYLCILNGLNDDILHWPFDRVVQISIIDQVTGGDFGTNNFNCSKYSNDSELQKPTKEIPNKPYHVFNHSLYRILENPNLTINNKLIIKFSTKAANIR